MIIIIINGQHLLLIWLLLDVKGPLGMQKSLVVATHNVCLS